MSTAAPQTAEVFLTRQYGRMRDEVLAGLRGRLAAKRIRFDDSDLEAFYNQAWHALYDHLADGERVDNPTGFLVTVGYRRAIEEFRRLRPDAQVHAGDVEELGVEYDMAGQLDDVARLRQLVEGMKERLDERECQAASLVLIHGFTRPEAAEMLGASPKRMEKVMDGVRRKLATLTADIEGDWCRTRRSTIKAYALGLLPEGGERRAIALAHLDGCSACRRYVIRVRGLAAVMPPVALPLHGAPGAEHLNAMLAAVWQYGTELLGGLGAHVVEAGAAVAAGVAALAHGGHGGGIAAAAKAALAVAVVGATAATGLTLAGAFGGDDDVASRAARGTPTPTATAPAAPAATPPVAQSRPAKAKAKPHRRAKRETKRRAPRATTAPPAATPAPVVTAAPTAVPTATPPPPAPAPAITPAPTPAPTIVTDAAQEFDP